MRRSVEKQKINEVVIVEGKTDSSKLKSIFDVNTIETNGLALSNKKINEIISISKERGVILFLDPDGPGEKIRKKIMEYIPEAKQCFIKKSDIKKGKKIGVAEATVQSIVDAFKNITKFSKLNNSLSWEEYIDLDLSTKSKRLYLCNKLNISYCNNKQLFKRLNMLNLGYETILDIVKNYK